MRPHGSWNPADLGSNSWSRGLWIRCGRRTGPSCSMAFPPTRKGLRVVERPVTGGGAVRELAKPPGMGRLEDISPDGKTLLLSRGALDTAVFSVGLEGVQKDPKPLVQTGETISHTRFSPDGRWIVYTASAVGGGPGGIYSGGGTYVQPYPGPGLRKQVTSRGNYPVWRKDGREIVYLDEFQGRNYVWSVPVADPGGEFRAGTPVAPVPRSSSRDDVRGSELSGRVARWLTLLYSAGRGAAGV